jgi:AbrB family looped-hinge helix DNA binding protein
MEVVSVSPKFQVVIPLSIRRVLGLQPGQKLHAMRYGDRVELMPVPALSQARGFLTGIDTGVPREGDRVRT